MINLPEKYKLERKIPIKDRIPKEFKPNDKKRIRECLKNMMLSYQISGEEIHSLVNEKYNYGIIQIFDFEVTDIKKSIFLANLYQQIIKAPCVLRFSDNENVAYSLALKRLNQNNREEIIVTDTVISDVIDKSISGIMKNELENIMDYTKILNVTNKLNFYTELFIKVYLIKNKKYYRNYNKILESSIWYDETKMNKFYETFKELVIHKEKIKKVLKNSEKIKINQVIRNMISELDKI